MRAGERRTGQDAPISADDDDRYGFTAVADGLAGSIHALEDDAGTVIGIEGRWGAGKTSLLNLLLARLRAASPPGTHVIHFSPWLSGPGGNLAEALLLPVAGILQQVESQREEADRRLRKRIARWWKKQGKSRNAGAALKVLKYVQQTSGHLAPLADFAGNAVPGFGLGLAAKGMDALAKLDLSARGKTAAELRGEIESRLDALGLTFVVVIDDLDRLEPSQAVEVLRLVRSVADFTRFRYVMCYDRDVLAHAVQEGLGVESGRLYLQKIVPLSFSLPRPEALKLRKHFTDGALQIFRDVQGDEPDEETVTALKQAAEVYGESLATPREVVQALSAVRFRYPGLKDYVWFPDLCLLHLIRVTNTTLYDWAEHYLSERAIDITKDARLGGEEKEIHSEKLNYALAQFPTHAARSPWALGLWLPGVGGSMEDKGTTFEPVSEQEEEVATTRRRLASTVYWRYYFAYSSPGNVLTDGEIQEIIRLAAEDRISLKHRMLNSLTDNGVSSRTWFEHILTRLTPAVTQSAVPAARKELLTFLFNSADDVCDYFRERRPVFWERRFGMEELAEQLIRQLLVEDRTEGLNLLQELFVRGNAVAWIAVFMNDLMEVHGIGGYRGGSESRKFIAPEEMEQLRQKLVERMQRPECQESILKNPYAGRYLWAWRNIAGPDAVKLWMTEYCRSDDAFLRFLLSRRSSISAGGREFFTLNLEQAEQIIHADNIQERGSAFASRLEEIAGRTVPGTSPLLDEVQLSIRRARDY